MILKYSTSVSLNSCTSFIFLISLSFALHRGCTQLSLRFFCCDFAGIPILGICYGMQLINHVYKGKIEKTNVREDGVLVIYSVVE